MSIVKEVVFGDEGRKRLVSGINTVADAVGSTMGYRGRFVLIESEGNRPIPTLDGVSVARSIFLEDPLESLGAEFIKEAAGKSVDQSGDGTSATIVLAKSIINNAFESIDNGSSPIDIKIQIEQDRDAILKSLKSISIPIKQKDIFDVARISANNDIPLAKVIAEAFKKAGTNGVVTYNEGVDDKTYVDFKAGMPLDGGYTHPLFVTDERKRIAEYKNNPLIFISEVKVQNIQQIQFILEYCVKEDKELIILAEVEDVVQDILLRNKLNKAIKVCIVTPPDFGNNRLELLQDIAIATGGHAISTYDGSMWESLGLDILGKAKSVTVGKDESLIVLDTEVKKEQINGRVKDIEALCKKAINDRQRKYFKKRIARLSCGVSVIVVGANTPAELKEKIDRVDDAVHAVQASKEEGIVSGGGSALFYIYENSQNKNNVLYQSIKAPMHQILANAGVKPIENIEKDFGYDVKDFKVRNMFEAGIIDPTKVVRCALINAVSVACTVLMTNTFINFKRQE